MNAFITNDTPVSFPGRLAGCTALVTGAARGIGECIARRFAQEGAQVWLADVDLAAVQAVASQINGISVALDVGSQAEWEAMARQISVQAGGLDILVNSAGIAPTASLSDLSLEKFRRVMQVNAESILLGLQACLPALRQRSERRLGGSSVVNIASLLGVRALPGHLAYGASKAAAVKIAQYAAIELARAGEKIRINNILPAITDTPMVEQEIIEWSHAGTLGTYDPLQTRRALESRIPMGRLGHPQDIAAAALFLASSESAFMTAVDLPVDGGRMAE